MRYLAIVAAAVLCWISAGATLARADLPPATALSADRNGVVVGSADAPVQLEIFCEPQCPDCAKFEAASNGQLVQGLAAGRLAVTYRWLTFLDERRHNDSSAQLANALMVAADPTTAPVAYQNFVAELYRQQDRLRNGVDAGDVAELARASGIPWWVADRIASGAPAVETAAMAADNHRRLSQADPESPGTPTVYDLNANKVVDIEEPGWLDRLLNPV